MSIHKLRFKADNGCDFPDWEEKKFGDFVDTHLEKTSDKDKYPLYSLTIESGVQPKTDRYEREFLVKKEGDNYKIVPPNAFVYNPMNLRFGALKVNHEKFSVSVSGYYEVFSLKDDSVLAFWENYLVTPKMLNYYFSIATGSLIEKLRVHYSQFVKIKKPLPSLPEQQKIAVFLSTIDTVIEKQKETASAWEGRKKGVIEKLFSQEVRFKTDDGKTFPDWEEHKIKEFVTESKIPGHTGKEAKKLTVKLWAKGIIPKEQIISGSENTQYYIRHAGQLMYGKLDFLNCAFGIVPSELDGYESTLDSPAFDIHDISDKFLLCYITRKTFYKKNGDIANGSRKAKRIHPDVFGEMSINVPSLPEQQKIADCLSVLDDVIEKQKLTLAAWEELKKGLLQQMFV